MRAAIHRVGDDAVMDVATAPWERGLEAAEIRVALPSSVRRAQWVADDSPGVDATVTSELGRDVVHAIRRHLAAGGRWSGRSACDPALFAWLDRPRVAMQAQAHVAQVNPAPAAFTSLGMSLLFAIAAFVFSRRTGVRYVSLPRAARIAPVVLAAVGGMIQGASALGVAGTVSAGMLVALLAFGLLVPRLEVVAPAENSLASHLWSPEQVRRLSASDRAPAVSWVALAVLAISVVAGVIGWKRHITMLGMVAVDFASIAVAAQAVIRRT